MSSRSEHESATPSDPVAPSDPEDHGVQTTSPDQMEVEAGRLLANHARERLRSQGFEDDQIERWAQTYIAETGAGSTDDFVRWVADRQDDDGAAQPSGPAG